MTRAHIIILALLIVFFGSTAVLVSDWRAQRSNSAAPAHRLLYPRLASQLETVQRVEFATPAREPVSLKLKEGNWVVAGKTNYPIEVEPLREFLLALAETEIVEAKTDQAEQYAALGVQPLPQAAYGSFKVKVLDASGETLAHLIVGKTGVAGGSFVRKVDSAQSWLVSERLSPLLTPDAWLADKLMSLDPKRIRSIEIWPADGDPVALVKPKPGRIAFELKPPPEKTNQTQNIDAVRRLLDTLNLLRMQDVIPRGAAPDETSWHRLRIETFNGLVVTARVGHASGNDYLQLEVDAVEAAKQETAATSENADALSQAERVKRLQKLFQGRTFVLTDYQAGTLSLDRDALIKTTKTAKKNKDKSNRSTGESSSAS